MLLLTSSQYLPIHSTNLSINSLYIHYPLSPACVVTEDRTLTFTSMDSRPQTPSEILKELVTTLRTSLTPVTSPPAASGSPMALPASYVGDTAECGGFLLQVALFMEMQPQRFSTEHAKVAFLISLLTGKALLWARAIWIAKSVIINSYDAFTNHFKEVFNSATRALAVSDQLLRLSQGSSTPSDYTLQFRTLADGMRRPSSAPIVMD